MAHVQVNENNFHEEVEAVKGLVLLDFYATWCGPCKMLAPVLDAIGEENANVKICKSDVDEASALAGKFNVQSIPTVVQGWRGCRRFCRLPRKGTDSADDRKASVMRKSTYFVAFAHCKIHGNRI